jgi:hypothetical protein
MFDNHRTYAWLRWGQLEIHRTKNGSFMSRSSSYGGYGLPLFSVAIWGGMVDLTSTHWEHGRGHRRADG